MHNSLDRFLPYVQSGHLRMVEKDDLVLFGYTDLCTFDRLWNETTLQARGIIFEKDTGKIVARPFDKFFNYSEYEGMYGFGNLLNEPHYIQEKMDGSLGIVYHYDGKWKVATRGSFTSEQALRASEMLERYTFPEIFFPPERKPTYLVEIIYPENKIIVPYGQTEELVLLAVRNTETGTYAHQGLLEATASLLGMRLAPSVSMTIDQALKRQKSLPYTEEGWVVVFENGARLKIKGDDYMRIAKFKANLSPLSVWEAMVAGSYQEMLVACPEEIRDELEQLFYRLYTDLEKLITNTMAEGFKIDWAAERKAIALEIQKRPVWMQGALFSAVNKKSNHREILIKFLRPKANAFIDVEKEYLS